MEKVSGRRKKMEQLSLFFLGLRWVVNENEELYHWEKHWRPIDSHLFPYCSPDFVQSSIDVC